jgi:hypothetical protein
MLVTTDIWGGPGLGTFEEGPVDGGCAQGADFICGPRGGVFSCRPCDFSQLEQFKQLQRLANQLVVGLGMANTPAVITGLNSCEGGDILAIDGRVGPCTKRTLTRIVRVFGPLTMAPTNPLLDLAKFEPTAEYISTVIPELLTYLGQLVALSNAPKNVPAPPKQPIKSVDAPGKLPLPSSEPVAKPFPRRPSMVGVGIFAALAAVGLTAAGVYYYRSENL